MSKYFAFYDLFPILLLLSPLRIVICILRGGNNDKIVEEEITKFRRENNKIVEKEGNKNEKGEGLVKHSAQGKKRLRWLAFFDYFNRIIFLQLFPANFETITNTRY